MYTVLTMSETELVGSVFEELDVLYCPDGVNKRLPSGAKVNLLKKDVKVSLA